MVALGILDTPSPNTIAKYIPAIRKQPNHDARQSWRTFLANHMEQTLAMDLFTVPTITFRMLYVFLIVSHARRRIVRIAVTRHPTAAWVVRQLREATPYGEQPEYLIRDNDSIYGKEVVGFLASARIGEVRTAYRSPWQNPYAERLIGILRREILDLIVPLDERNLERLLSEFVRHYYHPIRVHGGLGHAPPDIGPPIEKSRMSVDVQLESQPILGGLYHGYRDKAA